MGTTDARDIVFGTDRIERMRIKQALGFVGIGTSSPNAKVQVGTSINTTALILHMDNPTNIGDFTALDFNRNGTQVNARIAGMLGAANTSGELTFYTNPGPLGTAPIERMRITYNGNVGIGTTAPASLLHSAGQVSIGIPSGGLGGAPATLGSILLYNSTNANTITINSGVTTATHTLILPPTQGAANTVLTNDGAGVLSWRDHTPVKISANGPLIMSNIAWTVTDMTINTPSAGDYMVWFQSSTSNTNGGKLGQVVIYVNGVAVAESTSQADQNSAGDICPISCIAYVTGVASGVPIAIYWKTSGNTQKMYQRTLIIQRVN